MAPCSLLSQKTKPKNPHRTGLHCALQCLFCGPFWSLVHIPADLESSRESPCPRTDPHPHDVTANAPEPGLCFLWAVGLSPDGPQETFSDIPALGKCTQNPQQWGPVFDTF